MSGGQSLSLFKQFGEVSGKLVLSGPKKRVNDAQKTNYKTLGYLLRGQRMSRVVRGGARITDRIYLETESTGHFYKIGDTETYKMTQAGHTYNADYRYFLNYVSYTDQEVEQNAGGNLSNEARYQQIKDLWFEKMQNLETDNMNLFEAAAWAVPDKSIMEAVTGKNFYSLPVFNNEYTNGLPASSDQPGGTWTTVMEIAGTTKNWKPTQVTYANLTAKDKGNLINALDRAMELCDFQPPPMKAEYFEGPTAKPVDFIACSLLGKTNLKHLHRAENDRWPDFNDPWGSPLHNGIPIVYVAQLDGAKIYPTGTGSSANTSALSDETDTTNTVSGGNAGPRYFGFKGEYVTAIWHEDRFMRDLGEFTDMYRPTVHVRNYDTWGNYIVTSRKRHFNIRPSADV